MQPGIPITIPLGMTNTFLIPADDGCLLVDAGIPRQEGRILAGARRYGFAPESVRAIVVTHAHWDHIGSLSALVEATRAPVIAQRIDAEAIERGEALHPQGLTSLGRLIMQLAPKFGQMKVGKPLPVEIVVDEEASLADYGVRGRLFHTPGHTSGSLSVLLDSGDAIVGDLCTRSPFVGTRSYLTIFGDSVEAVHASWRKLLDAGATRFLPAHGRPIPADAIRRTLDRAGHG